ncbi:unnamed protein product [Linum tenue]|uniref:SHSP domain-containing protein n=1 Tax=Linum tenue TaxID=586396 RepID=A0AAV0LGI5_9ROSI|nr:unnamed protein product [Linum tenue]
METQQAHISAAAPAPPAPLGDYEDFQPLSTWQTTESHHIVRLHLHGFRKEQMRVRLDSRGILSITGERPAAEEEANERSHSGRRRHRRFRKEIKVACRSPDKIRAKFSAGVLTVALPLEANPRDHNEDSVSTRISINLESAPLYCSAAAMSGYLWRLRKWFENLPRVGKVCLVLLGVALLMGLVAALSVSFWISSRHVTH